MHHHGSKRYLKRLYFNIQILTWAKRRLCVSIRSNICDSPHECIQKTYQSERRREELTTCKYKILTPLHAHDGMQRCSLKLYLWHIYYNFHHYRKSKVGKNDFWLTVTSWVTCQHPKTSDTSWADFTVFQRCPQCRNVLFLGKWYLTVTETPTYLPGWLSMHHDSNRD